jgi:hypothetical protein
MGQSAGGMLPTLRGKESTLKRGILSSVKSVTVLVCRLIGLQYNVF